MTPTSNLSKIKPKLRTEGRVSGNFGRNKVRAGSTLMEIGMSNVKNVKVTTQDEYLQRMYDTLDKTTDKKMTIFAQEEIKKILVQRRKRNNEADTI
jgi:hypothetical protein